MTFSCLALIEVNNWAGTWLGEGRGERCGYVCCQSLVANYGSYTTVQWFCLVINHQGGNGVTFHGIVSVSKTVQLNLFEKYIYYCVYLEQVNMKVTQHFFPTQFPWGTAKEACSYTTTLTFIFKYFVIN